MKVVAKLPSASKAEVRAYTQPKGIFLVAPGNRPLMVISNGTQKNLSEVPDIIENAVVYSLDKWELLDLLHGSLKLPEVEEPATPRPEEPKVIDLSLNIKLPAELLLKAESAILDSLRTLRSRRDIAVESLEANGRLLQGFTGRNILVLSVQLSGYSRGEVQPEDIAEEMASSLRKSLGFETRVHIKRAAFKTVPQVPLVRFTRNPIRSKGGRIIRLLRGEQQVPKIDRKKLEREVERLLSEAGVSEEFLSAIKSERGEINPSIVEKEIIREIPHSRGISVRWVRAVRTGAGYTVTIGIERTSRSFSDDKIAELFRGILKKAEENLRIRGLGGSVEGGYVVVERDVY